MAQKYIRDGETFNGDGTSSAAATVDGGVGAWNDFWTLFEGGVPAYGTLADGDIINIRALDASAIPLTKTYAIGITFGSSLATVTQGVSWVLDAGDIWVGITGSLTIIGDVSADFTFNDYNNYNGADDERNWINEFRAMSNADIRFGNSSVANMVIKVAQSGSFGATVVFGEANISNVLISLDKWYLKAVGLTNYMNLNAVNLDVELAGPNAGNYPVVYLGSYGSSINWVGGKIFGEGAVEGKPIIRTRNSSGLAYLESVRFPKVMDLVVSSLTDIGTTQIVAVSCDDGLGVSGANKEMIYDTRDDGFYPTLNAKLPNSTNDDFSYKIYPYNVNQFNSAKVRMNKLWTQAAAIKTIVLNFLIDDALDTPTESNTWVDIVYRDDATGELISHTSRVLGSQTVLPTSVAAWSALTYGATNLIRYKIEYTTPSTIKQDSVVSVVFNTNILAPGPSNILFLDSDPELT